MEDILLPCGQCIGCKLLRSMSWAARCQHEISLNQDNCFITLTYNDKNLPDDNSLCKKHFQTFMKKFRTEISPLKIRYFMAGEYGDETWRPHYHAIIFNFNFPDRIQANQGTENPYYISSFLSSLWKKGNHIITDANYETAAYVARYCTKKITGEKAHDHYNRLIIDWNEFTGEIFNYQESQLLPEYSASSNRPAIGKEWYEKYKTDCYPSDFLIVSGRKQPIPKYYDKLLEREDEYLYALQKGKRKIQAALHPQETTFERLDQRNKCKVQQANTLMRNKI